MPHVDANGLRLCYETAGDPSDPALLLIHGHGAQLIAWHDELVARLVALGLFTIRFDNRDVGCSTHLDSVPVPDLGAIGSGDTASVTYRIADMADDAAALLAALEVERAHVLGVSMGGMIAQAVAIDHPTATRSLTSVMSSPDPVHVGTPSPEVQAMWLREPPTTREAVIAEALESWEQTGSPKLGIDTAWITDNAGRQFDRAFDPAGVARQFGAIVASPDRRPGLATVEVPTLVVHGATDPLLTVEGGEATAAAVPGASLLVIDDMGHDLPRQVWPQFCEAVADVVAAGDAQA